ncbi:hypothetical protein ACFYTF_14995 [Nocardia thailandica]|uniref:Uncharacterized protein n=1 Tax=Nocardia thailandica TaxID=257275 RepID=A0ABW6PNZ3_9NOCA
MTAESDACTSVEDSSNGLRSAHRAGMRMIAVQRPEFSPAPDALAHTDIVLGGLEELTTEVVVGQ